MKKLLMFMTLMAFLIPGVFSQTITQTYTLGDIETDDNFTSLPGSSTCPGSLTVVIPAGHEITGIDVVYDMTSASGAYMSEQRSWLYSPTFSAGEATISSGTGLGGTMSYNRTGLNFANGATGTVVFELHAGRTWGGSGCDAIYAKVDNSTWILTVHHALIPTCPAPIALNVTGLGATDATLGWTAGGTLWDVYYGATPLTAPDATTTPTQAGVTSNPLLISSLLPVTDYTFYVRADCGSGDISTWAGPFNFTTLCAAFNVSIFENFDAVSTPDLPACWSKIEESTSTWADVVSSTTNNYSSPNGIRLYNSNDTDADLLLITPEIVEPLNTIFISFYARNTSADSDLILGTMSDPTDVATFTPVDTFYLTTTHTEYTIYLNHLTTTDNYIAFKHYIGGTYKYVYLDDILIDEIPSCPPVQTLTVDVLAPTSVDLSWSPVGSETLWNVLIINTATGDTTINTTSTTTTWTASPLAQVTDYEFFVQADCGAGDVSTWVGPLAFSTTADPLSGNYTINSTQPTAGTNFNSFTDFATAANLGGLAGPVVVDVVAGTGPYTEQIMLEELNNSSATNTLTINGNGDTLQFLSTTSAERYTLAFDGTDYVTVNDLIIVALGEVSGEFGWAVWLTNEADYNTFNNCEFHASTTATLTNFAAFVTGNSATGATTSALAVNNLTIDGCKAVGGYYGIVVNGPTSAPYAANNIVTNTEVTDFHLYGLYLRGQNNGLFSGNEISRPTRTTTGILYMLYVTQDMSGSEITKNRISNFSTVASTSTAYGIYGTTINATVTEELLIANNLIYGFENMNGTQYGMYMLTTSNTKFYHNTVSLDNVSHTGSSLIRAFHQSGTGSVVDIQNNIFSVTSNSTGTKYCMYFGTAAATVNSDNNVLHMGATSGTNNIAYKSSAFTTLADWQAAESNIYDQNSVDIDPLFMNPANNDLMPQAYAVDNIGANLLTIVPDDIYGVARTATPDPGAIEFSIPDYNAGMVNIISPAPSACDMGTETIEVVIKNFGMIPITSIELGYIVDGGTPVTEVFSGLNILVDEFDTLTFAVGYDFSALGIYSITAFTNLAGDTLPFNDTVSGYLVRNGHDFAAGDYFMGFEAAEYSDDWSIINPDGIGGWEFPYSSTAYAKSGSFSAYYNNLTTNTDEDWLFSRCFTFEQGETYELSFFYRSSSTSLLSSMDVYLMDAVSETATPISTIIELHDFTGTAHQQAVDRFTVPTTGTYYIAWKNFSAPTATKNSIDDINITLVPGADAAVVEITKPIGGCDLGLEAVEIVIVNVGAQAITTPFNVSYQLIGGTAVVTETIATPNIAVFDTLVYEFTAQADFSTTMDSIFVIMAWVDLTNDPIADNDTIWGSVMSGYTPVAPVATNDTVPFGAFATLNTTSSGIVTWFEDMLSTTPIHIGHTYITDSIFSDTVFYVQAQSGISSQYVGPVDNTIGTTSATSSTFYYQEFDILAPTSITIYSVDIFFTASIGSSFTIAVKDNTGSDLLTYSDVVSVTGGGNPQTVPVNFTLPQGDGYRMIFNVVASAHRNSAGASYPYEIPGLISITDNNFGPAYYYYFYNWVVGSGSGCTSTRVPVEAILETPICYFVTDVEVDTVTQDYVAVNWTAGGSETQWEIEYGPTGFTPGTGMTQIANNTVDTIFGLNHSTYYQFYVRGFCDPNYSAWNGPHTFLTQCGAITVYPYEEGFEDDFPPLCWTNHLWDQSKYGAAHTGTEWAYSNNLGSELTTPEFSIPAAGAYFSFWHRAEGASYPQDFDVLLSTDGVDFNDTIQIFTGVTSTTYSEFLYDLSLYANQNIWIKFIGQTGTGGAAWGVLIDDFFIDEMPACDTPTLLAVDTIEPHSVYLSWTGGIDTWEIEWDTTGFVQGTGTVVVTTDNPYFLSGLTPETDYEFYVRGYCIFDSTAWAGPLAFSTPATCLVPVDLDTVIVIHNEFTITWTSSADLWQIEWDTAGFVQGTGNILVTDDNPYTIDGLAPLTAYDVYIRAICDTVLGDTSHWVGPFTVTTTTDVGMLVISDMNVSIYPNPSNGLINIQMLSSHETFELSILNIQGQVLYTEQLSGMVAGSVKQMELNITSGLYFIRLSNGTKVSTYKLIIN